MGKTRSGHVLDGRYRLARVLGQGAFGMVYHADDLAEPGKIWAIKELDLQFASPKEAGEACAMLDREHKVLSWLNHASIVARREVLVEANSLYMVMEFVSGENLETLVKRARPLPDHLVVALAEQVCSVLAYLHGQKPYPVIFRDLKPANLMLTEEGNIKVIDFGIARLYDPNGREENGAYAQVVARATNSAELNRRLRRTADTHAMGTPGYAAPEQYPGSGKQTDGRADIYALGVMMYYLITRLNPADQPVPLPPVNTLGFSVDRKLEALIVRATQAERDKRFGSALALAKELSALRESQFKLTPEEARRQLVAWMAGKAEEKMTLDDAMHEMENYLKKRPQERARQTMIIPPDGWFKRVLRFLRLTR